MDSPAEQPAKKPRNWFPEEDHIEYDVDDAPRSPTPETLIEGENNIDRLWLESQRKETESRFSLKDLFLVTTGAAIVLTLLQAFRPELIAGILGGVLLVGILVLRVGLPRPHLLNLAWWVVLMLYVIAVIVAAMQAR